jgi:DNA primase
MDVIALAQAGFAHAVAPLGTALTEEQIQELWRLVPEPVICLDGDAAGERAALRAAERVLPLLKPGFSLRFALLPAGEDPDSLVRAAGPGAMAAILAAARPLVDMVWRMETADRALDTPERRAGLRTALRARIARIADPVVAGDYRIEIERRLEELLGRPRDFQGRPGRASGRRPPFRVAPVGGGEAARRGETGLRRQQQAILLATLVNHPALIAERLEELVSLDLPRDLDNLRRAILNLCARHPDLDSAELRRHLNALGHGEAVDRVVSAGIVAQASFARPDAPLEEARAGWSKAMQRLGARAARDDIEAAERHLAEQMTEESWVPLQRRLKLKALEEGTSSDPAAEGSDTETG